MSRFISALLCTAALLAVDRSAIGQVNETRAPAGAGRYATSARPVETPSRPVPEGCYEIQPGLYVYPPPTTPVTGDRVRPGPYYVHRAPTYYERSSRFTNRRSGRAWPSLRRGHAYDYRRRATRGYGNAYPYGYDNSSPYHDGYGYAQPYAAPPYGYRQYDNDLYGAYEQGRYDADNDYLWFIASARAGLLIDQSREKFKEAIIYFRDGKYDRAAINMLGAAEKNQADPASRLHAGHSLFALGQYDEAVRLLARAFELAPSLAFKNYDIRDEYGEKEDFERHLLALKTHVDAHPGDAAAVTLMGYVTFYSEGPGAAYPYLARAAKLNPLSYFIPKLERLARYASKGEAGLELMPKREKPAQPDSQGAWPPSMSPPPTDTGNTPAGGAPRGATTQYERLAV